VDYLGLVQAAHDEHTIGQIAYRALALPGLESADVADQPTSDHDEAPR